ncbi:leucine-rich repeat domain-containing protein [Listeria costaricensis]|uniref:leucine-rich repeat domain-containing protein n=1 Tax=Listeria costaricensis TaxID=2026604 RepID=UPI000C071F6A|nr:leucine-rich repeat domain-containing protein [Listeria costaricensis]
MKKQLLSVLLGALLLIVGFHVLPASASEAVTIPDDQLREAITKSLNKPKDAILTEDDMKQVTELDIFPNSTSTNVNSLEGLQYATNLKKLMISGYGTCGISDLSPISNLTSLETLSITEASISDLTPIAGLTNLTFLQLHDNKIEDISVLANFPKLEYLELSGNFIDNIDVLAQLTNLQTLKMNGAVSYIGVPDETGNVITDLTPLENLTKLSDLELCGYGDQLTDISPLAGLVNLKDLRLFDNQIVDVSAIQNMTHLEILYLDNNDVQNLPDMSNLTSLTDLLLNDNLHLDNEDVEKIGQVTSLEKLYLGDGNGWHGAPEIDNIEPLANLKNLTELNVCETSVSDISPLADLPLRWVELDDNKISDVTPLAGKQFQYLTLSGNQITDISSLDLSGGGYFNARNQDVILEDGYQNAPTAVTIADNNGDVPALTWSTAGSYTDGKLAWTDPGENQVNFASAAGDFTGTIRQKVNAGDPPIKTSNIYVKYVDENGIELAPADTYTGNVGDEQSVEAKSIDGYTLQAGQASPQTLTYTTDAQTVEFVYVADTPQVIDSTIYVKYVDENGKELATMDTYTGPIGSEETIRAREISGYSLKEGQNNSQTVTYTDGEQTIAFVYVADAVSPADDSTDTDTTDQSADKDQVINDDQSKEVTVQENKTEPTTAATLPKTGDTETPAIWLVGLLLTGLGIYGTRKFVK